MHCLPKYKQLLYLISTSAYQILSFLYKQVSYITNTAHGIFTTLRHITNCTIQGGQPQKSDHIIGQVCTVRYRVLTVAYNTKYSALYQWLGQYIASAVPTNDIPCVYIYVSTQYNHSRGGRGDRIPMVPAHADNRPTHTRSKFIRKTQKVTFKQLTSGALPN